jgi:hypothetical protein
MKLPSEKGISPFLFVNLFFLVEKYHNIRDGERSKKKWYSFFVIKIDDSFFVVPIYIY